MTALSSLNNSLKSFVTNNYGLGEEVQYYRVSSDTTDTVKKVKQYKETENKSRRINDEDISDVDIFLLALDFEPEKNDTITENGKVYYVDTINKVSENIYRIYTTSDTQAVPQPNRMYSL